MKRFLKFIMVALMVIGITFSILNFVSVGTNASIITPDSNDDSVLGTWDVENKRCTGKAHNCSS